LAIALCAPLGVSAQSEAPATSSKVQTATLLNSGFEIVSTNYLSKSIVITLQRANRAFLCELNLDGSTIHCIEIK
jgi:hypothetical protein